MGDRITLCLRISLSAWTWYLTVLERPIYYLSFLSIHLPGKMMVGPSREGWEIPIFVLARELQNHSSFWLTSSVLNRFWAWELAHVWKLSKNAEHLLSYGVAFLSLWVIYLHLLLYEVSLVLGGCLSLLPPRILYPGNRFIAPCRPGLLATACILTLVTITVPTWLYSVKCSHLIYQILYIRSDLNPLISSGPIV